MSVTLPDHFLQRMDTRLNEDFKAFQDALNQPAVLSIRLNEEKIKNKLALDPVPWCEKGYYLEKRPSFVLDPFFHAGSYYVQEASSMLLEAIFKQLNFASEDIKALDLCGAPGGKTTHLLSLISNSSLLVANETIRGRADILKENAIKWGKNNVVVTQNDPKSFSSLEGFFDLIAVDAPCSGEGLFRKDTAAVKEWSEGNLRLCCERQERILHDIWPALKEEGYLIYSTCTYNPEENEHNISKLLALVNAHSVKMDFPKEWGIKEVIYKNAYGYYCYPHRVKGEGFFFSVLQKKSAVKEFILKRRKKDNPAKTPDAVKPWIKNPKDLLLLGSAIINFPEALHSYIEILRSHFRIISLGTKTATIAHKNIIPDPALAFSNQLQEKNFINTELSYEEALRFLKKETPDPQKLRKGFNLVNYKGKKLGFAKMISPTRINNYYPKEWRIRMDIPEQLEEIQHQLPLNSEIL